MTNPQRPTAQELAESTFRGVKDFVSRTIEPLRLSIKALSDRFEALGDSLKSTAEKENAELRAEVAALKKMVEEFPRPEKGDPGPAGEKGADFDIESALNQLEERMAPRLEKELETAVAALPLPKDGRDGIDGKDGRDGKDGKDGKDGEKGIDGRDGVDGHDGINGKDGADGIHGRDAFEIAKAAGYTGTLGEWLMSLRGTDGLDGRDAKGEDGRDGLSCDEIVPFEDARSYGIRFMKDETVLSETKWNKPTLADLDEGTWEHRQFQRGSHVTWGGSTWFAKCDTSEEPGRGEDWRLMAKKGRDGRDRTERQRSGDSDVYRIKP